MLRTLPVLPEEAKNRDEDRFTVYAFDDRLETPAGFDGEALIPATARQRYRAEEFLAGLDARGGTEMAQPLKRAAEELVRGGSADKVLILVTDGQVGNEDGLLRRGVLEVTAPARMKDER